MPSCRHPARTTAEQEETAFKVIRKPLTVKHIQLSFQKVPDYAPNRRWLPCRQAPLRTLTGVDWKSGKGRLEDDPTSLAFERVRKREETDGHQYVDYKIISHQRMIRQPDSRSQTGDTGSHPLPEKKRCIRHSGDRRNVGCTFSGLRHCGGRLSSRQLAGQNCMHTGRGSCMS